MNPGRFLIPLALWGFALSAKAEDLSICYNYGCATRAIVHLRGAQLSHVRMLFAWAENAEAERNAIAKAIGVLQTFAGQQTPTFRDRGRNLADEEADGRMDCIDHSVNNTLYMNLMKDRGWLKFHKVLEPARRAPLIVVEHWASRIAEHESGREFVVDSWFFDNGHAAIIFPLEEWMNGAEPDE